MIFLGQIHLGLYVVIQAVARESAVVPMGGPPSATIKMVMMMIMMIIMI